AVVKVRGVQSVLKVLALAVPLVLGVLCSSASAADRYALIVTGANGEDVYAGQYGTWRQAASVALIEKLGFDAAHIVSLFDGGDAEHASTAASVRKSLDALRARMKSDDALLIMVVGGGSAVG